MPVSANNFTRSYKIPRRQNASAVEKQRDPQPSTSSPLSKNVTVAKNSGATSKPATKSVEKGATSAAKSADKTARERQSRTKAQLYTQQQQQSTSSNNQKGRPSTAQNQNDHVSERPRSSKRRQNDQQSTEHHPVSKRAAPLPAPPRAQQEQRNQNDDPIELLDRIWQEMDAEDRQNKNTADRQSSVSPTGSPFLQTPTPTPSANTPRLTRQELMNIPRNDSIFRSFLSKPGLMERILGYKMLHSRVDTFENMLGPAKLDECEILEDHDVDYGVPPYEQPSTSVNNAPLTKPSTTTRGPQTPPGDPDDTALSTDEWHSHSAHSPRSSHHQKSEHDGVMDDKGRMSPPSLLPPPLPPKEDSPNNEEFTSRAELLQTFSQATNTPVEKLEELIGADLQHAIGRVAKAVLLNTLKDALRNVSSAPNSPKPKELNRVVDTKPLENSPAVTGGCEMECSSTDSNPSATNNDLCATLLPPPPAPPIEKPKEDRSEPQNVGHRRAVRPPSRGDRRNSPILQRRRSPIPIHRRDSPVMARRDSPVLIRRRSPILQRLRSPIPMDRRNSAEQLNSPLVMNRRRSPVRNRGDSPLMGRAQNPSHTPIPLAAINPSFPAPPPPTLPCNFTTSAPPPNFVSSSSAIPAPIIRPSTTLDTTRPPPGILPPPTQQPVRPLPTSVFSNPPPVVGLPPSSMSVPPPPIQAVIQPSPMPFYAAGVAPPLRPVVQSNSTEPGPPPSSSATITTLIFNKPPPIPTLPAAHSIPQSPRIAPPSRGPAEVVQQNPPSGQPYTGPPPTTNQTEQNVFKTLLSALGTRDTANAQQSRQQAPPRPTFNQPTYRPRPPPPPPQNPFRRR